MIQIEHENWYDVSNSGNLLVFSNKNRRITFNWQFLLNNNSWLGNQIAHFFAIFTIFSNVCRHKVNFRVSTIMVNICLLTGFEKKVRKCGMVNAIWQKSRHRAWCKIIWTYGMAHTTTHRQCDRSARRISRPVICQQRAAARTQQIQR